MIEIVPKDLSARPRHHVVALAYDGLALFEFGMAADIFGEVRLDISPHWYRFSAANLQSRPVRAAGGVTITTDGGIELLGQADTIIIPGWPPEDREHAARHALVEAHARGARLVSICTGSFLLASAGLLDGRRATTHWRHIDRMVAEYPDIEVVRDVLYLDGGRILTSAGGASGVDLCLHLVRQDYGSAIANMIARRLVVATHRGGDQRQFVERPLPREHEAGRLGRLMDEIRARLDSPWTLVAMADRAGMSRRTLVRRFNEAAGLPPAEWLRLERVGRARDLLETSAAPIEEIARLSGFGTPAALRHHFARQLDVTPTLYRQQFGRQDA